MKAAVLAIQTAASAGVLRSLNVKEIIKSVLESPGLHLVDPYFGQFAQAVLDASTPVPVRDPISYRTWGDSGIDPQSHAQMRQACALPMAVGAALMPDAHVGYGLPIGGVLALDNAVVPYAVGVDIACRMKLSVLDMPAWSLTDRLKFDLFERAIEKGTRFGVGSKHEKPQEHPVMDQDWWITRVTRENKDKAWKQLGTSGSGNHFVEFGHLTLTEPAPELGLEAGEYIALLSHSGSRGTGAAVCSTYSAMARAKLPKKHESLGRLAWLDLDSEAGQEYWAAMNLMGDYAAANHDVIHRLVSKLLGAKIIAGVENHHNFAWKEVHGGKEVIVHRKGATPAGQGSPRCDSRLDGGSGLHRSRPGQRREPEFGLAWSRTKNVSHSGEAEVQLERREKKPGEAGGPCLVGGSGRSSGSLQEHRRCDARAAGPRRDRGSLRSENRQDVRRRQQCRRLSQSKS